MSLRGFIKLPILLLSLLLLAMQPAERDRRMAREAFSAGIRKGVINHFEEALDHFSQAIALDSLFAEAYLYRGMAHLELKENKYAYEDFRTALKLDPSNALETYYFLGLSSAAMDDHYSAILYFDGAIAISPEFFHFFHRGQSFLATAHYEDALKDFEVACRMRSDHPELSLYRAMALYHLGRYDEALSALRAIEKVFSFDGVWHYYKGHSLQAKGEEAAAESHLARAVKPAHMLRREMAEALEAAAMEGSYDTVALHELGEGYYNVSLEQVHPSGIGVQIVTFSKPDNVQEIGRAYQERYAYPVFIYVSHEGEAVVYKVSVGNFSTRTPALELRSRLRDDGYTDSFIVSYL